jgi:GNAT superfamily N-acetyltransferase
VSESEALIGELVPDLRLAERRSLLGRSAALWTEQGRLEVGPDNWIALSGTGSVAYNLVVVFGSGEVLDAALDEVTFAGVPVVLAVAGIALGEVQRLMSRGWRCIGSTTLMARDLRHRVGEGRAAGARRLTAQDHAEVANLLGDVFGVPAELALSGVAGVIAERDGHSLWGARDSAGALVSCMATVRVDNTLAVWSMATAASARRRGYGAAALQAALASAGAEGVTESLLSSSREGESLYRALGYREVERWQQWSRPRWVFSRA